MLAQRPTKRLLTLGTRLYEDFIIIISVSLSYRMESSDNAHLVRLFVDIFGGQEIVYVAGATGGRTHVDDESGGASRGEATVDGAGINQVSPNSHDRTQRT